MEVRLPLHIPPQTSASCNRAWSKTRGAVLIVGTTRRLAIIICTVALLDVSVSKADQIQVENVQSAIEAVVPANEYPWSAVGKLTNGVIGACTAVLIARHYALTAAHCLFMKHTRRFLPAEALHFILGYENQRYADHLRVLAYFIPSTYDPARPFETIASDWALLQVTGSSARPLDIRGEFNTRVKPSLATAGYSTRTPYRMTGDREWHFVGRSSDNFLLFDTCDAPDGFSGGPILVQNRQSYSVAGIRVGNQVWQGRRIAIAVSSESIWREIRPCIEADECYFQHFAGDRDQTTAEIFAGLPNLGLRQLIEPLAGPQCGHAQSDCDISFTASRRR